MRAIWAMTLAACGSSGGPTAVPSPPPPPPPASSGLAIEIRNETDREVDLYHPHGTEDFVSIIDEAGKLAPLAAYLPPYGCEVPCGSPHPTCGTYPELKIPPHGSQRIPWDGSLRRPGKQSDGWPCYDRLEAPAGAYLISACASLGCAVERIALPRHEPVVLAMRPQERKAGCDLPTLSRALRVAYGRAALEGVKLEGCPELATCDGKELDGAPGACKVQVATYESVLIVRIRPQARDGIVRSLEVWIDGAGIESGNFSLRDGTWGATGAVFVGGKTEHHIHTHGGDPAHIYSATWSVYNRGDQAATLELRDAGWVTSFRTEPMPGAKLEGGPRLTLAPHAERDVTVAFGKHDAYQSWNDHFAVDATFVVDGTPVHSVTDLAVSRVDPR